MSQFLFPRLSGWFLLRVALLAGGTWYVGAHVLRPMRIDGASMEPTYHTRGVNFCLLTAYRSRPPARGDVVALRYGGTRYMLLKRVLAFAGETVEFRQGACYVDGTRLEEPYVAMPCDWNVAPRKVADGCVYVMGDNRSVPFENHVGGEIACSRVAGRPLW